MTPDDHNVSQLTQAGIDGAFQTAVGQLFVAWHLTPCGEGEMARARAGYEGLRHTRKELLAVIALSDAERA